MQNSIGKISYWKYPWILFKYTLAGILLIIGVIFTTIGEMILFFSKILDNKPTFDLEQFLINKGF